MSASIYDKALLEKIKSWVGDTNFHVYGADETRRLFQVVADENKDKIQLPIIAIRRSGYEVLNMNMRQLSYNGMAIGKTCPVSMLLNAIPIKLQYQLDLYTRYYEQADELSRNLMFSIMNYNRLDIIVPYNGANFTHRSTMRVGTEIQDNSAVPERLVSGQFTRLTMNVDIDDAYIWDVHERQNKQIVGISVEARDFRDNKVDE